MIFACSLCKHVYIWFTRNLFYKIPTKVHLLYGNLSVFYFTKILIKIFLSQQVKISSQTYVNWSKIKNFIENVIQIRMLLSFKDKCSKWRSFYFFMNTVIQKFVFEFQIGNSRFKRITYCKRSSRTMYQSPGINMYTRGRSSI